MTISLKLVHRQLRPKVNNYGLTGTDFDLNRFLPVIDTVSRTVEKGEGYDLNRSLFERLVLREYPHTTLREQHRMRPEISDLIRHLTYPDLLDAPKTKGRDDLRGIRDNVVFINHDKPEDDVADAEERREMNVKSSKQNRYVDIIISLGPIN